MKVLDVVQEADEVGGPAQSTGREHATYEQFREVRQSLRDAMNHLNAILAGHFDRGQRFDRPDRDTLYRLSKAADMVNNANHVLAAGTPDDKPDPMDV